MINQLSSIIRSYFDSSYDWIPILHQAEIDLEKPPLTSNFHGKLLLKQEIPLDETTLQQFLSKNYFTKVTAIEKHLWGNRCRRCGNKSRRLFAMIPCVRCHSTHLYCRKCIEMGRVLECEPLYYWTGPGMEWPSQNNPCQWQGDLTVHQQHASDRIVDSLGRPKSELLVWAV